MPRLAASLVGPLAFGFALGAATVWFAMRPPASAPVVDSDLLGTRHSPPTTPDSAIAAWLALRTPDGSPAAYATRADSLRVLLLRLPANAFPRLLDTLADATAFEDDRALCQIAFAAWIETDAASATIWAGARPEHRGFAHQALSAWAALDLPAAVAWACAYPDENAAFNFAYRILVDLAAIDPARALALVSSRGEAFLEQLFPRLLAGLAKTDPAGALQTYAPRLWKNGEGFWRVQDALAAWAARDPSSAITWLLAQPRRGYIDAGDWLGRLRLPAGQKAAWATALATAPDLPNRQSALAAMLSDWAGQNRSEALAWLGALPDPHLRTVLLERTLRNVHRSPASALPLALALPAGDGRADWIEGLLGSWAQNDSSAALRWIQENSAHADVTAAATAVQASILATIARDEPATAIAEWETLPVGEIKTRAAYEIALAWGQSDPAAALRWQSEQGTATGEPFYPQGELVVAWAREDGLAALRWAESLTGDSRQIALSSLAGNWDSKIPRAATADLYSKIQDPALRVQFVTAHVGEWLTKDPAAAKAWLESQTALTPAQTAALLSK